MDTTEDLRISIIKNEPPLQASKWLQIQVLLDKEEMSSLFEALGPFEIFLTGCLCPIGKGFVSHDGFLEQYSRYVEALKAGQLPEEAVFRSYFSSVFTVARDHLFRVLAADNQQIIRVAKPVIQLQMHKMDYSLADGKFRPMVFGMDSIYWGIQFSYPQLYQNPIDKEILQIADRPEFPNTRLFRTLQRWVRHETIPTPFEVSQKKINVPMRLGKNCLSWINHHPQLIRKGLQVKQGRGYES